MHRPKRYECKSKDEDNSRKTLNNCTIRNQEQVQFFSTNRGCPRGVMVKVMDSGIVESEFELHSCYYFHFRAITLRKGMNPLILPAMG